MKKEFTVVVEQDEDGMFVASVPELHMRTISMEGKAFLTIFASVISRSVGAP